MNTFRTVKVSSRLVAPSRRYAVTCEMVTDIYMAFKVTLFDNERFSVKPEFFFFILAQGKLQKLSHSSLVSGLRRRKMLLNNLARCKN